MYSRGVPITTPEAKTPAGKDVSKANTKAPVPYSSRNKITDTTEIRPTPIPIAKSGSRHKGRSNTHQRPRSSIARSCLTRPQNGSSGAVCRPRTALNLGDTRRPGGSPVARQQQTLLGCALSAGLGGVARDRVTVSLTLRFTGGFAKVILAFYGIGRSMVIVLVCHGALGSVLVA